MFQENEHEEEELKVEETTLTEIQNDTKFSKVNKVGNMIVAYCILNNFLGRKLFVDREDIEGDFLVEKLHNYRLFQTWTINFFGNIYYRQLFLLNSI